MTSAPPEPSSVWPKRQAQPRIDHAVRFARDENQPSRANDSTREAIPAAIDELDAREERAAPLGSARGRYARETLSHDGYG